MQKHSVFMFLKSWILLTRVLHMSVTGNLKVIDEQLIQQYVPAYQSLLKTARAGYQSLQCFLFPRWVSKLPHGNSSIPMGAAHLRKRSLPFHQHPWGNLKFSSHFFFFLEHTYSITPNSQQKFDLLSVLKARKYIIKKEHAHKKTSPPKSFPFA